MMDLTFIITTILTAGIIGVSGLFKNGQTIKDFDPYRIGTTFIVSVIIGAYGVLSGVSISENYVMLALATLTQIGATDIITNVIKGFARKFLSQPTS